ncbi:thiopeptide-type bacteriocin biosynthesis protein [Streptacidiphilus sp. MAP12-16]|uniref:lantibiotic dehydratase n=1 Tax=Streptacidiphilus sp. MAP12-16 TaxID=3156300 RepID=UPI0035113823
MADRQIRETPFVCGEFGLLRAPVLPAASRREVRLDVRPGDPDEARQLADRLRSMVADPLVREAVHVSSRALSDTVDKVFAGRELAPADLWSAVLSLSRYRLRMAARCTPFGLMAGVAAVAVDRTDAPGGAAVAAGVATGWLGSAHRRAPRVDMGWLMGLVARLEQDPAVLPRLHVVANGLAVVRGDRLELPSRPGADYGVDSRQDASSVSVRHTAAVRAALDLARDPVRCSNLVQGVLVACPDTHEAAVLAMLQALVRHGLLLTELSDLAEAEDPSARLSALLDTIPGLPVAAELREIQAGLAAYAAAHPSAGRAALDAVAARMRQLHGPDGPQSGGVQPGGAGQLAPASDGHRQVGQLIQVDLALDADVRLPPAVATEVERAAGLLWSIARPAPATAALRQYHTEFLTRYGARRGVPLKELLDPARGLGAPAGYRMPPSHRPPTAPADQDPERDRELAGLAARALAEGVHEIVLDEETVGRLAGDRPAPPASLELTAQVLAESVTAMAAGGFRLVVSGGSPTAGATFGRFAHLLPMPDRTRLADLVRTAASLQQDAIPVQLACQPFGAKGANLLGVPRWLDHGVTAGGYADRRSGTLGLDDLLVSADAQRFHVLSRSLGTEIVPSTYHLLNPEWMTSNLERFLREVAISDTRGWQNWEWGTAESLPFLPRIRYGRTVLTCARWRTGHELRDGSVAFGQWCERVARWRELWRVPELVRLAVGDRHVELDLTESLHLRILRQDIQRHGEVILQEAVGDPGWLLGPHGAHHNEIVFPLLRRTGALAHLSRTRPVVGAGPAPAPGAAPVRRVQEAAYLPGGEWLYAKLYGDSPSQSALISGYLPRLLSALPAGVDRWFFLRFRDPDPHLRLRFHGEPGVLAGDLVPELHRWAQELQGVGLIGRLVLDGYDPELERYGGPEAIQAAERVFHADSLAVVNQLRLCQVGRLPVDPGVLAAANYLRLGRDFACGLCGDPDADWTSWLPAGPDGKPWHDEFRTLRDAAVRLVDPYQDEPSGVRVLPGGELLLRIWARRATAVTAYGRRLAELGDRAWAPPETIFASLLHLHHNRLNGVDPEAETRTYGIAADALRTHRGRRAFLERQATPAS